MLGSNCLKSISGKKNCCSVSFFSSFWSKNFFPAKCTSRAKSLERKSLTNSSIAALKVGYAQHQNGFTSNSLMYLTGQRLIQTNFRLAAGSQEILFHLTPEEIKKNIVGTEAQDLLLYKQLLSTQNRGSSGCLTGLLAAGLHGTRL